MLEMTMTEGERGANFPPMDACRRGRNATVLKYTDVTLVFRTLSQSSTDSFCQILSCNSSAEAESGGALGPEMPAFVTVRLKISKARWLAARKNKATDRAS